MEYDHKNNLINTLDVVVKLSAVTISIGFIISISYDYGYFMAFGLSFSDIPSTINDHLRNSLICIPYSASTIALWLLMKFFNDASEQAKMQHGTPTKTKMVSSLWKFSLDFHGLIFKGLGLIGIITYIVFGNRMPLSFIVFGVIFVFYEIILVKLLTLYDFSRLGRGTIVIIIFFPLLVALVFMRGNYNSKMDQKSPSAKYKIYLKDASQPFLASNIRYFDKSLFFIPPKSKLPSFIQLGEIRKIELIARNEDGFRGVIDYFGYELINQSL